MVDSSLIAFSPFYHAFAKKQCPRGLNSRTGEKRKDTQSVSFFLSGGFNSDIFASEALHCNGLQISNKKYSQFF